MLEAVLKVQFSNCVLKLVYNVLSKVRMCVHRKSCLVDSAVYFAVFVVHPDNLANIVEKHYVSHQGFTCLE